MEHCEVIAQVRSLGAQVCEATGRGDFKGATRLRSRIHSLLRKELDQRPELAPGVLRVKAAWCNRRSVALRLLHKSFSIALRSQDTYQMAFSALAIAAEYAVQPRKRVEAKKWFEKTVRLSTTVRDRDLKDGLKRMGAAVNI